MDIKDTLITLSEKSGVSGYEHKVADYIELNCPWADEIRKDKLGNLIMFKKATKTSDKQSPKVMLAAHMDEIGLIITKINENGFLHFSTIGGIDQRVMLAQEVTVHGKKDLLGIIGAKPPHVQAPDEREKSVEMDQLFIDIGCDSAEQAENLVSVGDLVTINRSVIKLNGSCLAGKAMDDRACVAVLLECLKALADINHIADVYAVATVQEEVGVRGATTSTFSIVPDIGIALDVGHGDMPGVPDYQTIKLANGPGIAIGPHVHPKLHQRFVQTAENWNISYTLEPAVRPGGTDAYAIQITQDGIPTMLLSLPLRYMHTPVETLDYEDVRKTARLLTQFIAELDWEFVEGLPCF
ncbi:MAG: M42 family metallopeptidase [Firmicutes bacterium]|nr:M42 family metallopeptidase [Bacillota bacterium]